MLTRSNGFNIITPWASTVAASTTGIPSVRSLECRDERRVNAFQYVVPRPTLHLLDESARYRRVPRLDNESAA